MVIRGLARAGLPAICVETRHVKAFLKAQPNKTDRNDARGIAQMMRVNLYRPVHVKTLTSQKRRALLTARKLLQEKAIAIENDIRGLLRNFGLKVGAVGTAKFEERILELTEGMPDLAAIMEPLLAARGKLRTEYARLHRQALAVVKDDATCRRLMTIHGVGPVVALANRHYGYRRIAVLLSREGWRANHKRLLRLMREDNLLCLRKSPFVPMTTDSRHDWCIVPNLARGLQLTDIDQLWVADITYVHLAEEFAFLAIVLDAFSRKVIGWAIATHLKAELAIEALDMAVAARRPRPDRVIHHSDRGVQYACADYAARLADHGIQPSMSRVGNPYDNAKAERFMRTLKEEEVDGQAYRDGRCKD